MEKKIVTVLARIKARDGMAERVKNELMGLVGPTRSESGCINYDLHQSVDNENLFMFYENWTSKEDLDAHAQMPYIAEGMKKSEELLAEPVEITLWEMVSEEGR